MSSAPSAPRHAGAREWWRDAVIYQIYLRSFADGNGDGVGDLAGVRSRLGHLVELGVDAVWITPWFRSPMHDGGYDISDYRDIDPLFGTLDDARCLLAEAHAAGLRVVIDLAANHTSDEHPWFREALAAEPGSRARARYHFRDGSGPGGAWPPNDWISSFGGPAWTRVVEPDGRPGQWYLHLFAPQQPDLNWDDPEVRAEFEDVLRFWFDLGVDGLRIDAASAFAKHPELPDHGFRPGDSFSPRTWQSSPLWDVDEVHPLFRSWRAIADGYSPPRVFVGEITVRGADRLSLYLRPDELHTAFELDFLKSAWSAPDLRAVISRSHREMTAVGAPPTWVLSNHDEVRHVTRYGRADTAVRDGNAGSGVGGASDLALGTRRARAALLLMLALPGTAYLYQGEELGLWEVVDLPPERRQDPVWFRTEGATLGRDGCRVPLPWSGARPPFGFSPDGVEPWLPQPAEWATHTVRAQTADAGSMLHLYRSALQLRRALLPELGDELLWDDSGPDAAPDVLDFSRGTALRCVVNLGSAGVRLPPGRILLASTDDVCDGVSDLLPPDTAVWLEPRPEAS